MQGNVEKQKLLAEDRLRETEARFRSAFDNAPIGMALVTPDGRWMKVNRSLRQIVGYSEQELLNTTFQAITHPDDLEASLSFVRRMLAGEIGNYQMEKRYYHKLGHEIWVLLTVSVIRNPEGVPIHLIAQIQDITQRKQNEEALTQALERLRALSHRLVEVQEAERRRLAHELHDEIGQALTLTKVNIQAIGRLPGADALKPNLKACADLVEDTLQRVRDLSVNLRPSVLDDLGLIAAVRWYVYRYARQGAFAARVRDELSGTSLPPAVEITCFRIVQEALTNIVRHARASQVSVKIQQMDETLSLTVQDDGVGFDVNEVLKERASLGLLGMQERVSLVEGQIEIDSAPGRGTEVRVSFPLSLHPPGEGRPLL